MPPKPATKGSAKKPSAVGTAAVNKNWEAGLTKAPFEEVCTSRRTFLFILSCPKAFLLIYRTVSQLIQVNIVASSSVS